VRFPRLQLIRKNWEDKSNSSLLDFPLLIIIPSQWLRVYNGRMDNRQDLIENAMIEDLEEHETLSEVASQISFQNLRVWLVTIKDFGIVFTFCKGRGV
jgi:hypothetical protein